MESISEFIARTARERQERDAAAAGVVISTVDKNPDQVAGDMALAQQWAQETGNPMPPMPLVEEYRPVFQQQIEAKRNSTVLSQNPKLAAWLRDPQNAALAKDDVENMGAFEATVNAVQRFGMSIPQTYNQAMAARFAGQAQDAQRSFAEIVYDERDPIIVDGVEVARALPGPGDAVSAGWRYLTSRWTDLVTDPEAQAQRYQMAAGEMRRAIAETPMTADAQAIGQRAMSINTGSIMGDVAAFADLIGEDPLSFASFLAQVSAESLPAIGASLGVGLATRDLRAAALTMGVLSGVREYGASAIELIEENGYDPRTPEGALAAIRDEELMREANARGLTRSVVIGAMDTLSFAVAGVRLADNTFLNVAAQSVAQAAMGASGEALGQVSSGQRFNIVDVIIEGMAEFVTAPVEVGVAGVSTFRENQARARVAADRQRQIEAIAQQSMQSKLRARMPDVFRAWVERATENGPAENLYVPADKFTEYFQSIGMDPWALADEMDGVSRSDLETALATGGDLRIPTATYAARLAGSEADQFFMENMRFDPDEFTSAEARAFEDTKAELMAEALNEAERIFAEQQELRTYEQEIFDTMVERLRMAGRATDVAKTEAALYPAFYKVMAERAGIPLGEFIRRYPLPQVRGDTPQGMQAKNVDDLTRTLATARAARQAGVNQPQTPLLEFISNYGGIIDRGGELAARDAAVVRRGRGRKNLRLARDPDLFVSSASAEAGRAFGPDDVAQAAIEAGLMADNPVVMEYKAAMERGDQIPDITRALWDEIDRELRGDATMTDEDMNAGPSQDDQIAELERYLGEIGVSLDDDDATIRAAIERDQAEQRRMYGQAEPVGSDAFREWAGTDAPVIEPNKINSTDFSRPGPFVMRAFHGTTHDFDRFDASIRGNREGQFGAVNYFTSSEADASGNYGDAGPDLTARIERRAEEISEAMYDDPEAYGLDPEQAEDFGVRIDRAREIARQEVAGGEARTLEVYIRTERPFVIGGEIAGERSPFIEFVDFEALDRQAIERVAENEGVTVQEIEANRDDYQDMLDDARYEIQDEAENPLIVAVQTVADRYGVDPGDLFNDLYEITSEGATHSQLEQSLRSSEALMYAEDPEDGSLVGYQMLAEIIRELGFDSIILKNADIRFSTMEMQPFTSHVHVFDEFNTNIKAVNNQGSFDRNDPRILYQGAAPDTPVQRLISQARERIARKEAMSEELASAGKPVMFEASDGQRAMAGPDMSKPGGFRLTYLGADGQPSGHSEFKTLKEAVRRALDDQFEPVGGRYGQAAIRDLASVEAVAAAAGVDLSVSEYGGLINVSRIIAGERGKGSGTRVMEALAEYADATGKMIALTPSADFGGSVSRLRQFYKRFGFIDNKGRNKDFSTRETMYRMPNTRRYGQPAYHGSPHLFERFSLGAIGTGEGAQAFGWGMYFAGRREVAEYYRQTLTLDQGFTFDGKPGLTRAEIGDLVNAEFPGFLDNVSRASGVSDKLIDDIVYGRGDRQYKDGSDRARVYDALKDRISRPDAGRLFEVDIPEDAELLDWDAPLSEQPASVLEKLQPLLPRFTAEDDALLAELGVEVTGEATGADPVLEMTGAQFYQDLADRLGATNWPVGANADQRRAVVRNAHRAASEALRASGIPGHRYLDGGSRADGDGSRNYVIYDEDRIQVTRFEQEQRGSVAFPGAGVGNGDTVISLFRKADLSTFLHESGHYFLTVLQDMAGKGEASAVAEFETIKAWWRSNAQAVAKDAMRVMPDVKVTEADVIAALDNGTTGNVLLDAAIDVGMQEQFARSFEAYLMEGKAPSVELRGAFEKFRAWLLSVYRSLRGLNVEIDDNIRAVFDRMLATDQEIAEARTQTGDRGPMFTEAPAGMSPDDWARYQAIGQAAQDEAASRLLAETMAPIRREQEAAYRAEKDAVRAEVEPQINARREYRAIEWMGNRRWLGADQPQGLPDMRLDRQALVDRYGEGVLKTLPRGKFTLYANEGGVDPEIAAGLFGFSSADEMILALERAPKRAEAIAAEVEKIMFERHGDPLRDGTVEAKAIEAVHGDKRARMLAIELDVLRAAPGGTKSAVSVFREMARGTLAGMRVRDAMAANRYLTAERKAGEASYRAAANGDMQAAAEAKRRQLLNHMLYTEARKIEAEVEAAEKLAARLQKKSTREKLAGDYLEAIDEILGRYDFRRLSGKAEDRRGALQAYVERMKAEGRENELAIPERVLQDAARTPYKRLTVEHLRGVVDSLKNIEHTARLKQKLIDAQSQRDLDAVVDDILGAFDANVKPQPPGRVGTTGERFRAGTRAFLDLVLNATTLLREIDGFKDLGPAFSNLKAPIDAAMNRLQARREKAAMDLDALYGVYTKDERRKMAVRQFVPEIGASLSKWERIAVALNMGNEGNYQRLTDTNVRGGFTEAQVKAIVASLDARDARFVQSVWDYLETFRGDIEAREKRVTGVSPKWVEARPVQIAGIDLRGGYYPLKYDPRLSSLARDDAAQDIAKSLQAGRFGKAQTRNGHLKERATSSGRPVELDISVLHRHVQQVVYDLELSEPVANSWRILQDGRIRDAFVNAGKQADFDALEIWLKDVAEGELRAGDVAGQMARRFKSNFTAAKLAFNLSTVAVQITGVAQSMVVVGKADFLKGVQMALRPGIRDEVHAKSQFMRDRSTTFNKDIFDLYNDPRLGPVASRWTEIRNDWIAPAGFWLMTKVQSYLVDVPTWLAGYNQGLRKFGGDEAKAVAYADDIVKRSQASGIFSDRSAVERGSGSMRMRQNEFLRLFTTLGSYMFAKFNVAYERTGRARQVIEREGLSLRSAQEAVSWTIDVAFLFTLEAVLYAAIKGRLPDEEDDEDDDGMTDEWAAYLAKGTALSFMSTIPFVRDIGSVLTGFGGGGAYGAITEELAKPLIQAGQGEVDAALVKSVISATGLFTGLPAGQINRAVDAGWRQAEGDDVSPAEYLLGRIGK